MPASHQKARELRYALTLSGVVTLRMMGLFLILPVFVVLAAGMPGYTPLAAGLAVGIYGLTQALLQQPFGWLSDHWGRKPVLMLGLGLFAIGGVVAALAETMPALIAGRALQGCGAIAGVAMAFAADVTRPERRPVIMAILGIGIGGAFLLSMVLSVPLATLLGLRGLFWLTALFALAGMGLIMTLPAAPKPSAREEAHSVTSILPVWLLSLSVFLLHGLMTVLFVTLPPMLVSKFGLELTGHWRIYVPTMVVAVLLMLPILRSTGRNLSESRMIPWAFIALALAMVLMPLSSAWLALAAAVTVYFLGFNLLEAGMPALLSRLTGSRGRGRRMGLYSTFQFLGAFFGGVAGGWLLGSVGSETTLLAAGLLCLLWGIALKLFSSRLFLTREAT